MRVLEVFGEPVSNGGQESFVFNVIQHMNMEGLHVDVLTPYYCDNEYYKSIIESAGGQLIELKLPFCPGKSRGNIYKPIKAYLKNNSYNVVHIHSGSISVLALTALAAKRTRTRRIIVHSHVTGNNKNIKHYLTKFIMSPLLDICPTDYCACSKEAGEWKFSSKAMKRLIVVKNGIDIEKFSYSPKTRQIMRDHLGIKQNDYVIGHVGRFAYQKNQEFILELLLHIKKETSNAKALLIGTGETLEQIKEEAKKEGLNKDVFFIGNVNNTQDYLQAMDVFVLPSRFEGLGIVGIEAQAAGLKVIASLNVPRELKQSSLVQFISTENIDQWEKAIIEAQNSKRVDVKDKLREAGYDIRETAHQIEMLYQNEK